MSDYVLSNIISPNWTKGGTGLTNFPKEELEYYISVIKKYGDDNYVISRFPMSGYTNTLYSLHYLNMQQTRNCTGFWDEFFKYYRKFSLTNIEKTFDKPSHLSTIETCKMHKAKEPTNQQNTNTVKIDSSLLALLSADADKIKAPALKIAAEKIRKQQEEKDAENALRALKHIQDETNAYVSSIREIRKQEKLLLEKLKVINDAKNKFMKDGDVKTMNLSLAKANVRQVYFL